MKLASITINTEMRELPHVHHIDMQSPQSPWVRQWTVTIDGPSVYLASPKGWSRDGKQREDGAVTTIEVPRSACSLRWLWSSAVASTVKYGPQVIGDPIIVPDDKKR